MSDYDYDVLVIGSGFGGSVAALRLAEKGYRVGVFESGRRWDADSLPKSNWNARKSIWAPKLGLTGPQRISLLGKCLVLSGAALGVFLRSLNARHAAERGVALLFMQSLDNSLTSYRRRGRLITKQGTGEPNPTWIPIAHDIARRYAKKIDGTHSAISPTHSASQPRHTKSAAASLADRKSVV